MLGMMDDKVVTRSPPHVRARIFGPKDGVPCVALHGWLDNAASFERLAPLLPHLHIHALDLPGHGMSEHLADGTAYHFIEWVCSLFRVLDDLDWQRCHLIGHSMGAGIASLAAGTLPDRVERLVLIEGLGAMTTTPDRAPKQLEKYLKKRQVLKEKNPPAYASIEEAMAARARAGDFESPAIIESMVRRGLIESEGRWRWRTDPQLTLPSPLKLTKEHVVAFLQRIECPTLLIRAEDGLPFDPDYVRDLRNAIRDLNYVELPGRHHVHIEDPVGVASAINRFYGVKA